MTRVRRSSSAALWYLLPVLALSACADTTPGKWVRVFGDSDLADLKTWRVSLAVIMTLQAAIVLATTRRHPALRKRAINSIRGLLFMPIAWTKLGEWWYRLWHWVSAHPSWGVLLTTLVFLGTGSSGVGNIVGLVLIGFVFRDLELLRITIVPSLITATLIDIALLATAATEEPTFDPLPIGWKP